MINYSQETTSNITMSILDNRNMLQIFYKLQFVRFLSLKLVKFRVLKNYPKPVLNRECSL